MDFVFLPKKIGILLQTFKSQVSQQFEEALVSAGVPVEDMGFLEKKQER